MATPCHRLNRDESFESAAAYVLGGFTADECAEFEAHLQTCQECSAVVRALDPILDALNELAPRIDPPRSLRTRVLEAIRVENTPNGNPSG